VWKGDAYMTYSKSNEQNSSHLEIIMEDERAGMIFVVNCGELLLKIDEHNYIFIVISFLALSKITLFNKFRILPTMLNFFSAIFNAERDTVCQCSLVHVVSVFCGFKK